MRRLILISYELNKLYRQMRLKRSSVDLSNRWFAWDRLALSQASFPGPLALYWLNIAIGLASSTIDGLELLPEVADEKKSASGPRTAHTACRRSFWSQETIYVGILWQLTLVLIDPLAPTALINLQSLALKGHYLLAYPLPNLPPSSSPFLWAYSTCFAILLGPLLQPLLVKVDEPLWQLGRMHWQND